jgi:hypothetical protein
MDAREEEGEYGNGGGCGGAYGNGGGCGGGGGASKVASGENFSIG